MLHSEKNFSKKPNCNFLLLLSHVQINARNPQGIKPNIKQVLPCFQIHTQKNQSNDYLVIHPTDSKTGNNYLVVHPTNSKTNNDYLVVHPTNSKTNNDHLVVHSTNSKTNNNYLVIHPTDSKTGKIANVETQIFASPCKQNTNTIPTIWGFGKEKTNEITNQR